MKHSLLFALLGLCIVSAQAQQLSTHSLKDRDPRRGNQIWQNVATSELPFKKKYHELSEAEQAMLKSLYDGMGPDDEPPYPARGTGPLFLVLKDILEWRGASGLLEMTALIGADGRAKNFNIYSTPDTETAHAFAAAILKEKFKPALCKGQPCEQEFLFRVELRNF